MLPECNVPTIRVSRHTRATPSDNRSSSNFPELCEVGHLTDLTREDWIQIGADSGQLAPPVYFGLD
jgi:hypothetical protein